MIQVDIKLKRWDRDPASSHNYGDRIDKIINDLVGGTEKFTLENLRPTAQILNTDAKIELHEDGPLIQFIIEQIPAVISAISGLVSVWIAWKASKSGSTPKAKRKVTVRIGKHEYVGSPNKEELEKILFFIKTL